MHFLQVSGPCPINKGEVFDDLRTPCLSDDEGASKMNWSGIPGEKLAKPIINMVCRLFKQFYCQNFLPTTKLVVAVVVIIMMTIFMIEWRMQTLY